jgi:hypothetical protein
VQQGQPMMFKYMPMDGQKHMIPVHTKQNWVSKRVCNRFPKTPPISMFPHTKLQIRVIRHTVMPIGDFSPSGDTSIDSSRTRFMNWS